MLLRRFFSVALAWRCLAAHAAPVTFKVGFAEPVASVGPHLAGSFQGWDPARTSLRADSEDSDMNGNGIYEVTMDLAPGSYEFKFLNGNSWDQAEAVPSSCSEATSGMMNRIVVVEDADAPLEVHVCFQECLPCAALPACKMFNCPPGLVLRGSRLDVPGASSACCKAVEEGKGALVVRSSAFSDGNWAEFWMNGALLYGTGTRGLTVLELEDDLVKHAETFDTYLSSSDLEGYLSSVTVGNLVLMGIVDEGSAQLSVAAKALIASCGAQKIEEVAFRSSYALIGRKGGSEALSEVVLPEFAGTSVAVAQVTLQTTTTTTLAPSPVSPVAFCDMKVAEPPMSGKLALDGNLELDAGCRFRVWESPEIASCLAWDHWDLGRGHRLLQCPPDLQHTFDAACSGRGGCPAKRPLRGCASSGCGGGRWPDHPLSDGAILSSLLHPEHSDGWPERDRMQAHLCLCLAGGSPAQWKKTRPSHHVPVLFLGEDRYSGGSH